MTNLCFAAPLHLEIKGVNKEVEENVRSNLTSLAVQEEFSEDTSHKAQYKEWLEQEILLSLQPFGYYEPKVSSDLSFDKGTWRAVVQITLGEPVRIEMVNLKIEGPGTIDPNLIGLQALFPLKKGDIFVHPLYEQGKKALLSKTMQSGYLKAHFIAHRVEVDIERKTADVFLTLETGPRHYFSETSFNVTKLSDKFLRRFLPYEFGEAYSPEKILILQNRLMQSDYFSQVNVKPLFTDQDIAVPVAVELSDAKPNQYQIGAGFGTDTGVRGKLAWTRRQLNSMGHRFSAQAVLSEIFKKAQADYIIPGKHPWSDELRLNAAIFEDEYDEKPSTIYEAGIIESRDIFGWQRLISLYYRHEKFKAYSTYQTEQSALVLPSITFIRTERDDNLRPRHGKRLEVTLRGALDALFSDASFVQTYLQYRQLEAFSNKTKLLFRLELGATLPTDANKLPPSQRFYAGGDTSIRGYGYRTLPNEIDKEGVIQPVGGAFLAVGSIELIQNVRGPFGVFTFIDAGNAFRPSVDDPVAMGIGVGIEYATKLGPIKVAIAKPTTKDSRAWRIHASFGPEL